VFARILLRANAEPEAISATWNIQLEGLVKLSISIQKGKETKKAVITLTKESNAEYVFKRLFDLGWLVVSADKVA
jgi:hypothetical protein